MRQDAIKKQFISKQLIKKCQQCLCIITLRSSHQQDKTDYFLRLSFLARVTVTLDLGLSCVTGHHSDYNGRNVTVSRREHRDVHRSEIFVSSGESCQRKAYKVLAIQYTFAVSKKSDSFLQNRSCFLE